MIKLPEIKKPPVVELDTDINAAYVRFSNRKVAKTEPINSSACHVAVDLAANGDVIGIEFVGVSDFSISNLVQVARVPRKAEPLVAQARYVPAKEKCVV